MRLTLSLVLTWCSFPVEIRWLGLLMIFQQVWAADKLLFVWVRMGLSKRASRRAGREIRERIDQGDVDGMIQAAGRVSKWSPEAALRGILTIPKGSSLDGALQQIELADGYYRQVIQEIESIGHRLHRSCVILLMAAGIAASSLLSGTLQEIAATKMAGLSSLSLTYAELWSLVQTGLAVALATYLAYAYASGSARESIYRWRALQDHIAAVRRNRSLQNAPRAEAG